MALTVVDAGIIIAILDSSDAHHAPASAATRAALAAGDQILLPASAYAEVLVAPFRRDGGSVAIVDAFVDALPAIVQPINRQIARAAAQLRAQHGQRLRLPDALVVATAIDLRADRILTTDRRWPDVGVTIDALEAGA